MKKTLPLAALAVATLSGPVLAQDYNWSVGAGVAYIHTSPVMDDIHGPFTPSGLQLKVDSVYTPFLSISRHFGDNWDVEFAGGLPPKTKVRGKGPSTVGSVPYDGAALATLYQNSPTLLLNYTFFSRATPVRPFLGVGINYTKFFDITPTPEGENVNGGPTTLNMSNSFGPAGQVGVEFRLQDRLSLKASVITAVVKTELKTDTAGVQRSTNMNINPVVGVLDLEYAF